MYTKMYKQNYTFLRLIIVGIIIIKKIKSKKIFFKFKNVKNTKKIKNYMQFFLMIMI